ncbi:hypothetical protein D3870_03855 [Noviherbaspirillum cavernae]|uniref:Uncharacterized protein n=1 Tax=Noviherbaspirillum cavernae TaxID=2320862 RepID=A0A418WYG7_9BURK|nr:hypothetical protein [Noviherbaspirillum cavernae]RJG05266.1 hypothetical protein D3870_03855 [Noviherbaspirillum cavernae]
MGNSRAVSRLKTLYQRQQNPSWDASYVPGILATPKEAPSISRAYTLTPSKLAGREVHLLSTAERDAALLGLYHPAIIGLQEQRMLSPGPTTHPLWTFPNIDRSALPPLKGVIDVAERLNVLDVLPRIVVPHPERTGERMPLIYPWCGDLLWAIVRPDGRTDCINWSIKDKRQNFMRPGPTRFGKLRPSDFIRKVLARHEVEAAYYANANIRTVQIAGEEIDSHVAANLRQLFLHHRRQLFITDNQRAEILHRFQSALAHGITPAEVITVLAERGRYSVDQCRSAFYQAIWENKLKVDLFQPILINCPMRPEIEDVTVKYAKWFDVTP